VSYLKDLKGRSDAAFFIVVSFIFFAFWAASSCLQVASLGIRPKYFNAIPGNRISPPKKPIK
jgi:hypothetical protein